MQEKVVPLGRQACRERSNLFHRLIFGHRPGRADGSSSMAKRDSGKENLKPRKIQEKSRRSCVWHGDRVDRFHSRHGMFLPWGERKGKVFKMSEGEAARRRSAIVLDLFERYYSRVYAFARRSVGANVAEDATQEAFLRLLQHPRLEELDISISYMLRVVPACFI